MQVGLVLGNVLCLFNICAGDVGEVEIVSYSLFAQLNIGGELIISISDTNKAKDQRRTVFMKHVIVRRWFING